MIRTERLILRPGRADDLAPLHAIFSDPRAMRYWDCPPHDDIAQTRRFLDGFIHADTATREEYIVERDGQCIGKAGLWRKAELGYILHPDHWGRGLATEAIRAILPRGFAKFPDIAAITAEIDPRNAASEHILRKLGFQLTGTATKTLQVGDEWCDSAFFALPRPVAAVDRSDGYL